ncbi:hypothetical protein BDR06DRAFT_969436 [Suillus hirtellus]|nr:hypothetical protein BDR06DRAFT_969436 [Suillus hirtellus]
MSHPSNCSYSGKVQFEIPMETNKSAYGGEAGMPPVNLLHTQQPFNLGFTLPQPAQQPAPKPFNLGFNLPVPFKAMPLPPTNLKACRSFQFEYKPSSPIREWQLELIMMQHQDHPYLVHCPSPVSIWISPPLDLWHLGGEEFDHLTQMMVGGALGPGDDVHDPNSDEVLESNRVLPAVKSLLHKVDWAEAESTKEL